MAETIVLGLQAVADHFKKSLRSVQRWARAGMPKLSGKRFDLIQIQQWLDENQVTLSGKGEKEAPPAPAGQMSLTAQTGKVFWDGQGKKFQAQKRELDLRRLRGELVERKEVEGLFVARILGIKQGLLALSRALPPLLAACQSEREMEAIIVKTVRTLLGAFARPLPGGITGEIMPPTEGIPLAGEDLGSPEVAEVAQLSEL